MPVLHFKDAGAYHRNLAFRHINNLPDTATEVYVAGKKHKVKHSSDPKRVKIDSAQRKKEARRKR